MRCCGKSFAVFPEVFTIILFDTSLLQSDVQNLRQINFTSQKKKKVYIWFTRVVYVIKKIQNQSKKIVNPCFAVIILLVHHFSKHFPKQWLNHLWKVIRKIGLLLPYFHQLIINANSTETLMPILFSDCSRIFPWVDNLSEKKILFSVKTP